MQGAGLFAGVMDWPLWEYERHERSSSGLTMVLSIKIRVPSVKGFETKMTIFDICPKSPKIQFQGSHHPSIFILFVFMEQT